MLPLLTTILNKSELKRLRRLPFVLRNLITQGIVRKLQEDRIKS